MANAFDVALLVGAATLFALGLAFRARRLRFGQPEDRLGNGCERLKGLAEEVFTHDRILREKPEGLHHLLLFVAFAFPLAVIAIVQLPFSLPVFLAGPLSLLIEAAAVGGFYGTFRLFRRGNRFGDMYHGGGSGRGFRRFPLLGRRRLRVSNFGWRRCGRLIGGESNCE